MNRARMFVLTTAIFFARSAHTEEPPVKRKVLLVQTLETDKSDEDVSLFAQDLTEELIVRAAILSKPNGVDVRSETELRLVAQHMKEMSELRPEDCHQLEECLSNMFSGEADQLLRGWLERYDDTWVVALKLINLRTMGVERAESCAAENKEELIKALKSATAKVLGYAGEAPDQPELVIPSDGREIGVMKISGSDADDQNVGMLAETLGVAIRDLGLSAVTRGDLQSIVNYATERHTLQGTSLTEAMMEIAQGWGVSMMVSGNIGRIEKTTLIVLRLIDLQKGTVTNRVLEAYVGPKSGLRDAMKYACFRLFGRAPSGDGGPVSIVTDIEGQYRIDQGRAELLPQASPKIGLAAGKHQLTATSEGFFPYYSDFYSFGDSQRLRVELEPLPQPWYQSPVFLTIAGIVVAGTATAIAIAVVPDGSRIGSDTD